MKSAGEQANGPGEARVKLAADEAAMGVLRDFVTAFALQHRFGDDDRARVLIIVEEHVTNIVKYGYPVARRGSLEMGLTLTGDRLTIEIADDGQAFDPFNQPEADLTDNVDDRPIGRLGLHIIKSLTDEARYERVGDRNVVHLTRRIPGAG